MSNVSLGKQSTMTSTRKIANIAMLSAISALLMTFLEFPIPFFPAFLQLDFSELPALIGAFAMGPAVGALIVFIKVCFHLVYKGISMTAGVGDLANLIVGMAFVLPASFIYHRKKTRTNAMIGMAVGTVSMVVVAALANYYMLIPIYSKVMPLNALIAMMSEANKSISDIKSYIVYAVLPFNLIKALLVSFITAVIYKKLSVILTKSN